MNVAKNFFAPRNLQTLAEEILAKTPVDGLLFEESRNRTLNGRLLCFSSRGDEPAPCRRGRNHLPRAEDLPTRPAPNLKGLDPGTLFLFGPHHRNHPSLARIGVRSGAEIPLFCGNRLSGVLTLFSCKEDPLLTTPHLEGILHIVGRSLPTKPGKDVDSRSRASGDRLFFGDDLAALTLESVVRKASIHLETLLPGIRAGLALLGTETPSPTCLRLVKTPRGSKKRLVEALRKTPRRCAIRNASRIAALLGSKRVSLLRQPLHPGTDLVLLAVFDPAGLAHPPDKTLRVLADVFSQIVPVLAAIRARQERDDMERRYHALSLLYQAKTSVHSMLESATTEDRLFSELCRLLVIHGGIVNAAVYTLNPRENSLTLRFVTDRDLPETLLPMVKQFSLDPNHPDRETLTVRTFRSRRPGIQNNLVVWYRKRGQTARADYYEQHHWISVGVFPIFRGGEPYGILGVATNQKNFYDNNTADLLSHTVVSVGRTLDALSAERERKLLEKRLSSLISAIPQGVVFKDPDGRWLLANERARELFGFGSYSRWSGKTDGEIAEDAPDLAGTISCLSESDDRVWKEGRPVSLSVTLSPSTAPERILALDKIPLYDEDGSRRALILSATDITEEKRAEAIIRHMAFHDSLTDLPNRRLLLEQAQNRLEVHPPGQKIGIGILDLDGFKSVNDLFGHQAGDALLKEVSRRIRTVTGPPHLVARLGGDEFGLLAEVPDTREAGRLFEKILATLETPFLIENHPVLVSASIGAAFSPPEPGDIKTLLHLADTALYEVKKSGKNGWRIQSAELDDPGDRE